MNPIRCDTAILLFSRSAAGESVAKPLSSNPFGSSFHIAAQLIAHTRRVARHSGMKVFCISENQQQGANFGERFADAFGQLFARGFDRVISIGNDCPTLKPKDLLEAANQLDTSSFVFGPASDGGAYLIGMRRDAYQHGPFLQIKWQTPEVFEQLKTYASGDFYCLAAKSDIDSPESLVDVLRFNTLSITLKTRLLSCLRWIIPTFFYPINVKRQVCFLECRSLRGPPGLLLS